MNAIKNYNTIVLDYCRRLYMTGSGEVCRTRESTKMTEVAMEHNFHLIICLRFDCFYFLLVTAKK